MCGVIGLLYHAPTPRLGVVASDLLRTLEYRGYDSTGGAFQGEGESIDLRKGVGAPSLLVETLGMVRLGGQVFCGQVRWATFGAVDAINAQPHEVRCKRHLFGAHNGNVTNSDPLKAWLQQEGHRVLSDNDGEMVVHAIEHDFGRGMDAEVAAQPGQFGVEDDPAVRRRVMRQAIAHASVHRLQGSFAAVICDPRTRTVWAIKRGSSLYVGVGEDESGRFAVASSDLSSVLKRTRMLVPIVEGEFVEMQTTEHGVDVLCFGIRREGVSARALPLERAPVRSRLRAADMALVPPYQTFMEQEIAAQEGTVRDVVRLFRGGGSEARALRPALASLPAARVAALVAAVEALRDDAADDHRPERLRALLASPELPMLVSALTSAQPSVEARRSHLASGSIAADGAPATAGAGPDGLAALEALAELHDASQWLEAADAFVDAAARAIENGRSLLVLCCGSSYHAARAAAAFFDVLAGAQLRCALPGEFRGELAHSVRDGDVVVAVSQSGETKDLIDILNDLQAAGRKVRRVALVNNINSTLAQEKADVVVPLRCGPEIAVPATKSFMNQLAVFYGLALRLGRRLAADGVATAPSVEVLDAAERRFANLPPLLRATVELTRQDVEVAAQQLFLRPSMHILSTRMWAVAKEGALKIREVVLNHTEGYEASEFKHGPNTILGRNTLYGPDALQRLLPLLAQSAAAAAEQAVAQGLPASQVAALTRAVVEAAWKAGPPLDLSPEAVTLFEAHFDRDAVFASLDLDYPLVYVTGPDARDVALTISQINTHKIRRSASILIAEPNEALRQAIRKPPADNPLYQSVCIDLPRTGDPLAVVFSSTLVLQRLALRMSELKAAWLDARGLREHGVHPDVPKNVSKSITVD